MSAHAAQEIVLAVHSHFDQTAREFVAGIGVEFATDADTPGAAPDPAPPFRPLPGVTPHLAATPPVVTPPVVTAPVAVPARVVPEAAATPAAPVVCARSAPEVVLTPALLPDDPIAAPEPGKDPATMLAGLGASLEQAQPSIERPLDIGAGVDAVLAGPPATQIGGMAASARKARTALAPLERGRQDFISALQEVHARMQKLAEASSALLTEESLAPVVVTSTAPELLRAEFALDPIAGPAARTGQARARVLSVAAGGIIASQTPFAPGSVLGGGQAFDVLVVTSVGDADREVGTRLHLGPRSTPADVATSIEEARVGLTARIVPAGRAAQRLQIASIATGSHTGVALVDTVRADMAPPALGEFGLVRAPADTILDLTGPDGDTVRLVSPSLHVDASVEGLRLVAGPDAAGADVEFDWSPEVHHVADRVGALVTAAACVLDAASGRLAPSRPHGSALAGDPMLQTMSARVAAALGPATRVPVPGARVDRERLTFDRMAFVRAVSEDPVGTEAAVRAGARELANLARDSVDPRLGVLALRIGGELRGVRGQSAGRTDAGERMGHREQARGRHGEALRSLLDHLDDERSWLGSHLL